MPRIVVPNEFVVIDVETTGFKPEEGHVIVELAGQRIVGKEVADQFHSFLIPERRIEQEVQTVHGLTEDFLRVSGKPSSIVIPAFVEFLKNAVLIGHNIQFDLAFLNMHLTKLGLSSLQNDTLDTLELAKRYLILPSYSLASIAQYLNIAQPVAHRALADVETTRQVFLKLVERAMRVKR